MQAKKILKYIFALVSLCLPLSVSAAEPQAPDTVAAGERVRGVQYAQEVKAVERPMPVLAGVSVSADLAGMAMALIAPYGQLEAAARLNFKGIYFPIFEMGVGMSHHEDESTNQRFDTRAPYFRIGCDYNFIKNKRSGNRLFGGLRYAFTHFKYDLRGPDLTDPVWGGVVPYDFRGVSAGAQWIELVGGLEAKIWSFVHLGWSVRYRKRVWQKKTDLGQAWYVPGYGRNAGNCWGGTFNIIFDI